MNAPPMPARSKRTGPRFLGRYEIIGQLARGGMGTVYLARNAGEAGFQRLFAVKVLHAHLVEEAGFVDMLRDEARIAARIHHPNVVAVVDIGTQGDSHYIVMEYVEGPAFATLWKRSYDKRPLDMIVSVMLDTLEGLHSAHTLVDDDGQPLQLVHRDVSPQNVLVGVDGVARITDFGIAKAESRITSTQPGMRKGKLQFMSPEQIRDAEKIDLRTDIWAAGVVLYSLVTGEHLFRDDNDAATVHNVIAKEIPRPSSRGEKPPEAFDSVILKALERDPSKRFDSALEMADALRKAAAEANVVSSRHDVARYVTMTFGEELESRRAAIREVTRRRSSPPEYREYSEVTVLPSLPSSLSALPDGRSTPSSAINQLGSFEEVLPSEALRTVPPPLGAPVVESGRPDPNARRMRIALGVAVGVVLLLLAAQFLRSPPKTALEPETVGRPVVAVPVAPAPTAAPPEVVTAAALPATAEASPSPDKSAEPNPATAPDKAAESEKKSSSFYYRRAAIRPVAAPRREQPAPRAEPEPAEPALPRPTAAPQADFDTNPYLRH